MTTRFDVIVNMQIGSPNSACVTLIEEWCNRWNARVLGSSTYSHIATMAVPYLVFKRVFNAAPKLGKVAIPEKMATFVISMEVTGCVIVEVKKHASETEKA